MDRVSRVDVFHEVETRVKVETVCRNDDLISLKEPVRLMTCEDELIEIILDLDGVASRHLLPVLEGDVIGKGQFTQPQEAKEACEYHGDEEKIVVECGVSIVVDYELEVI